ncbi:MAG: GSCFA domain-containing protein [Flavobacteriaceae bacterium]|nr:GSCFA domain-containing protein [Flavobacteriaceae bacterium]
MKLQTKVPFTPAGRQICYEGKTLLMGSCFTENIGAKLTYFKFQTLENPFGVLFNPIAIHRLLERAIESRFFIKDDVFSKDGVWHCFEVHSLFNATSEEDLITLLNQKLEELKQYVSTASHLVFSYGTAWVYRHLASNTVVANCHKVSSKEFSKELLSVDAVSNSVEDIKRLIQSVNPTVAIITTLSPVRHLKDGFVENARSKAHLLAGLHLVIDINYFPAYELMMDELRDYRFYTQDLLHPNETAIEIIWNRFKQVWVDSKTEVLQKEIDVIQKGLKHRPFHPKSDAYIAFQGTLQKK